MYKTPLMPMTDAEETGSRMLARYVARCCSG